MASCTRPAAPSKSAVTLKLDDFGSYKDKSGKTRTVKRFTWENEQYKSQIQLINYGGTITSIKLPDKKGKIEDIVTGFDTIEEYQSTKNRYFGATIGRVANRIAGGKLNVEGVDYTLATNNGPNHLHGGLQGFDKVLWNYYVKKNQVILTYNASDLEEGYPGDVLVTVTFELTAENEFKIDYRAVVSKVTPVNLTNHSYFNLAGHGSGAEGLYEHQITLNADKYTEVGQTPIPTGKLVDVSETVFDFRVPKRLGDVINKVPNAAGFDFNFCVIKPSSIQEVGFVAKAFHPPSGRVLELYSDQPGVQFYTGNALPEDDASNGKGAVFRKHGAFCVETQKYPDAVHHANFPDVLVYPGEEYRHVAVFKFFVQK